MAGELVYGRYVWRAVAIGLVLVAAAGPAVELTRERIEAHADVPHQIVKHDHAPESPPVIKLDTSRMAIVGTAMARDVYTAPRSTGGAATSD